MDDLSPTEKRDLPFGFSEQSGSIGPGEFRSSRRSDAHWIMLDLARTTCNNCPGGASSPSRPVARVWSAVPHGLPEI
jgi:hypothetical protein